MAEYINDSQFEGKVLPFSSEAEQSVLGAIIVDPPSLNLVMDKLKPDHFYVPQNRRIYETLCSMSTANQVIDYVTLLERLKSDGLFDAAGGKAYLASIVQSVPTSANITTYAEIVTERYYVRSLMTAARDIIETAQNGATDADVLLASAEQKIYDIDRKSVV